jgi:hypothetical protein
MNVSPWRRAVSTWIEAIASGVTLRAGATGLAPIVGTDEAARSDALVRVPAFLAERLAPAQP